MKTFTMIGSVSHSTHRPQDLLPRFMEVLQELDPLAAQSFDSIPAEAQEDESHEWWDSEEAGFLLDELMDALNDCAPSFVYFGANPGDGADFGFWVDHEGIYFAIKNYEAVLSREAPSEDSGDDDYYDIVFVGEDADSIYAMWERVNHQWQEVWRI